MINTSANYKIRNQMEDVVLQKLKSILPKVDICKCEKCQMDILAYALNSLPPKYVVTEIGDLYSRLSELNAQFEIDVEVALAEAINVVSNNPKHK